MTPPSSTETDPSQKMSGLAAVQSEPLFRAMFEQAAVGIGLIETLTGRFLRVNQRYCEIVGLSWDEMTATTFMAITHPSDLQADLSHMEELKAGRIHDFSMEKRYFRSDGSIVWVDLTVAPLWKVGEQPSVHVAVVQDITERKRAQEALRITEGQLTEVLKNSTAMVFVKDREGRYLLVNHAFERQFGLNAGQILGKTDTDIFSVSQAVMFQAHDQEVIQSGMLMEFEEVAQYADGEHTSIVIKFPLRNAEGSVYAVCGIVTDITDRKRAEQNLANLNATLEQQVVQRTRELEESRQQLQAIVDGVPDAVFVKDLEGRYRLFNHAAERFVGKRQDEVIGRDDRFIFSPSDAQAVMEMDRTVLTSGVTMTYEDVATTADGVQRTFLSTKGPLCNDQGHVTGLFGIARDITERKQAEEQRRESEERFRNIFEHAGTGIAITDLEGRFLRCNPAYCALLGYTEAELRELNFKQVVHPADLAANLAEVDRLRAREVPCFEIENRSRHKDGYDVWVHKFVSLLQDDSGQPTTMFTLVTDITERRRMHEVLEQRVAERTAALRTSEVFSRDVLDSLSAHVAVLDASGVIVAVNRVWESAALRNDPLGLAQVGLGANYIKVCERAAESSPEVQQILEGIITVLAGRQNVFESEYLFAWPGFQQWFSMRVTPLRDRGGCVIVHEDVTDRKRAEQALRESEERLRLAQSAAKIGTFDWDIVGGTVVWQAETERIWGLHEGGFKGTYEHWRELVHPEDLPQAEAKARKALADPDECYACEHRIIWPDGTVRWIFAKGTTVWDGGKPIRMVGLNLDITERKQAEEALRASEKRFALAVEGTQDGIWDWDLLTNESYHSPRWNALLGLKAQASISPADAFFTRLHPDDAALLQQAVREHFEKHVPYDVEIRLRHESGAYRWFRLTGQAMWDEQGHPFRMVGSLSDITERRQAVEALQDAYRRLQVLTREIQVVQERERMRLSRELHDEFGQLLSVLKLKLGSMNRRLSQKTGKTATIMRNVKEAHATVDRLFMSLRGMVAALRPAVLDEFGLVAALQSMADDIREATGIDCRISATPEHVHSRIGKELEGTLYRIAQELITNVVRHAKATKATITLQYADGTIVLAIQDNGRGVDVHQAGNKHRFGLRGVQERAELLGGAITIDSKRKVGTTVTVRIPIELPLSPASQMDSNQPLKARSSRKRLRRGH